MSVNFIAIAAVSGGETGDAEHTFGIGYKGKLPWKKNRADMDHFKKITTDATPGKINVIIMGRNTWEFDLGKRFLPARWNVILTQTDFSSEISSTAKYNFVKSVDALFELLKAHASEIDKIFVIGGAQIYKQLFKYCTKLYLTKFSTQHECDTFITIPSDFIQTENLYKDRDLTIDLLQRADSGTIGSPIKDVGDADKIDFWVLRNRPPGLTKEMLQNIKIHLLEEN